MSELKVDKIAARTAGLRSVNNPCFVCGPNNPIGLGVTFRLEEDAETLVCRAEFTPGEHHVGFSNVTHGGIVFALLDDVMANWLWLQGEDSFTAKADIRYRAELPVGTPVALQSWCTKRKGRLAVMEGQLSSQADGFVYAEASASFMLAQKS